MLTKKHTLRPLPVQLWVATHPQIPTRIGFAATSQNAVSKAMRAFRRFDPGDYSGLEIENVGKLPGGGRWEDGVVWY